MYPMIGETFLDPTVLEQIVVFLTPCRVFAVEQVSTAAREVLKHSSVWNADGPMATVLREHILGVQKILEKRAHLRASPYQYVVASTFNIFALKGVLPSAGAKGTVKFLQAVAYRTSSEFNAFSETSEQLASLNEVLSKIDLWILCGLCDDGDEEDTGGQSELDTEGRYEVAMEEETLEEEYEEEFEEESQNMDGQSQGGATMEEGLEAHHHSRTEFMEAVPTAEVQSMMPAKEEEYAEALKRSEADALVQEQRELHEAIVLSKAEAFREMPNDMLLLRLTTCSNKITRVLHDYHGLAPCFDCVVHAGCEISPGWAHGAILMVPLRQSEVPSHWPELQPYHIAAFRKDMEHIKMALQSMSKRQGCPKLNEDRHTKIGRTKTSSDAATAGGSARSNVSDEEDDFSMDVGSYEVIIENTFYSVRSVGESRASLSSAPGGGADDPEPRNPRNSMSTGHWS